MTPINRFPDLEKPGRGMLNQLFRLFILTTRGDILTRGATYLKRLAIGTSGKVLHSDGTDVEWATLLASEVEVEELSGATYDDVQNFINFFGNRTLLSGGTITSEGDGDAAMASCTAWCKVTDSDTAVGKFFDFAGASNITLTDLVTNFIYLDYNDGTPQVVVSTAIITHGFKQDHIFIAAVYRSGNTLHIHQGSNIGIAGVNRQHLHHLEEYPVHRASGMVTSSTGTRQLAITSGVGYAGLNRITTNAFDTSASGTFSYWYYDGDAGPAAWVEVATQNAISNTQYNNVATGLVNLSAAAKRGVHWVYMDNDGVHLHVVYGQSDYSTAGAEVATVPTSLPPLVTNYCVLIAKIIVQKDQDTLYISYPWTAAFQTSLATDHGSLAGLLDDDHTQYVKESEFTASEDILVGTGSGTLVKATPAEVLAILSSEAGAEFNWNAQDLSYIGHIGFGNAATIANIGLNYIETFLIDDNSARGGSEFYLAAYKTSAEYTGKIFGLYFSGFANENNTQNWTNALGLIGIWAQIGTRSGSAAPSTITGAVALFAEKPDLGDEANDMVLTNYYGLYVDAGTLIGNSKLTNCYGIYIGNQAGGATLNYAIFTNAGLVHFGDNVDIATGKTFSLDGLLTTAESELTLDTDGAITVTQMRHKVDTFEGAASDDLVTINGGGTVNLIILRAEADARTIVVKHGSDNIWLQGKADVSLDDLEDGIMLAWDSTNSKWFDIAAGGGGLANIVEDTTPQLGGNLDVNEKAIQDGDGDTKIQLEESADEDIIRMDVGATGEAFKLSAAGILTLAKQSMIAVSLSANQSVDNGKVIRIAWDTENSDIQGEYDLRLVTGTAENIAGANLKDTGVFTEAEAYYDTMTAWNVTDGTYTTVTGKTDDNTLTLAADIFDVGETYKIYMGRFTAKEAGIYVAVHVSAIDDLNDGEYQSSYVYKNNVMYASNTTISPAAALIIRAPVLAIVSLTAGEWLDARVYQEGGANQNVRSGANSYFHVAKIA